MARSYRFKSDAELEEERSERELARNRRIATYGTNIPNVADVRAREQMDREARLEESAVASGRPAEEAKEYARALASGSRLEASKFEQQQRDKARQADYERTGFRTEGDRATYRTQEALRKLLNKPSAAVQFAANIDKSVALGDKSALNTEAGLKRAYEQGTRAGFSRQDIDQMIGRATARQKDMAAQKPREYTDAEISALQGVPTAEQQARDVAAAEKEYSAKKTAAGGAELYGPPSSAAVKKPTTSVGEPVTVEAVKPETVAGRAIKRAAASALAYGNAFGPTRALINAGIAPMEAARAYGAEQRALESEAAAETAARRNEQIQRLLREERPDYALTPEEVRGLSPEDRRARAAYLTSLRRRVTAQ